MRSVRHGFWLGVSTLALFVACGGDAPTTPTPTPTATLSGSVREAFELPTPVIQVRVMVVDGANMGRQVITDSQGRYTLPALAPGALTVQFSRDGYVDLRRALTLSADATLDVTLERSGPPTFTLSGTVSTPWNLLLDDAGVEAVAGGRVVGGGTTNRNGAYSIPTLPPQDYTVRVTKWGYSTPQAVVRVTADVRHDIVMDRGRIVVRGSVTEGAPCTAPIDEARVEIVDGPDAGMFVHTGRAGDFVMNNVRWGTFRLGASKGGYTASEVTVNVPAPGGPGVTDTEHFRLPRPGCTD